MRARSFAVLLIAALVAFGCTAAELKARKDNSWSLVPLALPDESNANPSGYGHPFRWIAFFIYPVGVVADYVLIQPVYMLAGVAPEWFGLTVEDAQRYQAHFPELVTPENAPHRFD